LPADARVASVVTAAGRPQWIATTAERFGQGGGTRTGGDAFATDAGRRLENRLGRGQSAAAFKGSRRAGPRAAGGT
jgi:hypothetical protein